MTVEENRGNLGVSTDNFPVGMRVLAVDDDPTCLMLLGGLLRKCQYQVTTISQARTALDMLRENRDRFDLIISDVYMPDMDGFKLLEHVGLEMDLPVIMLSANSDPKLVMKGITHGACDYLVKPVRIEELRNIWQHVIRRKKFDSKSQNNSAIQDKDQEESGGGQGPAGSTDQNGKLNRKRKDEEEEGDEDSEDPATQKKARVVWSIELHRKFVAAVNQLGIEKAVPKRILDMMNVEGLTRENVASHLQKYRLYLKRISSVASQQANMVAALGGNGASYIRMGSLDGLGDFRTLAGSGRLPNTALSSYPLSGMLGRLNSPAGVSLDNSTSSALIQPSHAQNLSNSINALGKFQPVISPTNQNTSLFQGIPSSLDHDPRIFTTTSTFTDTRVAVGSSINSLTSVPSNPLILQGNPQQTQSGGGFTNQSSLEVGCLNSESFNITAGGSIFLDHATQLSKFPSNPLPLGEPFNHDELASNSMRYNNSSMGHHFQNNPIDFSSNTTVSALIQDSRVECQEGGLVGDIVQNMNQAQNRRCGQHKQDYTNNSNNGFSTLKTLAPANAVSAPLSQSMDQSSAFCNRRMDVSLVGQSNSGVLTHVQQGEVEKSTMDFKIRSNADYILEQRKSQGGFIPCSYDSLDDLMNAMMKREQDGTVLTDGGFGIMDM